MKSDTLKKIAALAQMGPDGDAPPDAVSAQEYANAESVGNGTAQYRLKRMVREGKLQTRRARVVMGDGRQKVTTVYFPAVQNRRKGI